MIIVAITHGMPRPRNTLTEFEPVTFPMAASAYSEPLAAVILAMVSGKEVPMATTVMAVTDCFSPTTHPNRLANSPTMAVIIPIMVSATKNACHPFHLLLGGTRENIAFQKIDKK